MEMGFEVAVAAESLLLPAGGGIEGLVLFVGPAVAVVVVVLHGFFPGSYTSCLFVLPYFVLVLLLCLPLFLFD